MAEVNTKEMVSVTKEEMMDLNMEDMADFDIPMMSQVTVDDLMADVAEVQTILQCNNIGQTVDVNEIYEKLEELMYIKREVRIEYVATQLIYKSGIIDEPNVAPQEGVFRFTLRSNEDNLVENTGWSQERVPVSEISGCDTPCQNDVPFSNVIATAYDESVSVHPHELSQNFVSLPEPVTISQALTDDQNQLNSETIDLDIHHGCCRESSTDADTLIKEAKLIYNIFPHHDFEQIYACLRANKDSDTRVDDVTEMFLQTETKRGLAQLPCTEVAVIGGINTRLVDTVQTNPLSICAPSVFVFTATSNNDRMCHAKATAVHEKLKSNKYSVTASAMFPQRTSKDADLTHGNFSNSEVTDKGGCLESVESSNIFHFGNYIEKSHKIISEKLEMEAQHNEDDLFEKTVEVTGSSVQQKRSEEGLEQKQSEECVGDMLLFVEQKINAEVAPVCIRQKLSDKSLEVTPFFVEQTKLEESIKITPLSVEQKVSEQGSLSRDVITELAVSKCGDDVLDLIASDTDEDDTLSYASCKDLDVNVIVLKQETDKYNSEHTLMHQDGPNLITNREVDENVDFVVVQKSDVKLIDSGEDIDSIITDFKMIFPESDTDESKMLENRSRLDELSSVTDVEVEHNVTAVAETEDQCSTSFDSTCSDDFINFLDSLDEEHEDDSIVAKLHELFPDARMDYLIKISLQFDSLTDMASKVLESLEAEENDVGDMLSKAETPVSASLPAPSSQGCRKKEITYKEFESSLPHVDHEILMEIWNEIGTDYNAVKEFIAQHTQETSNDNQYHMLLSLFPQADPAFLREKCSVIGSDEDALKDFIEEQLQNKTATQYHMLQDIFPEADSTYLHEKCTEIGDDETAMREFVVEHLKKNEGDDSYHTLLAVFPEADPVFLREAAERIGDDDDAMKVFVAELLEEVDGVKFQTLLAVLPDADPDYLHATFEKIGNDEESVKVFLLEALENKEYPTREAFLKRQEMASLQRKYKEEFSIEDFIEMFPDPRKHFYEENNSNSSELIRNHGIAYLETRYRRIALEDIRTSFKNKNYNLTLTCRELDKWNGPICLLRETFNYTVPNTDDIPVSYLQEVAFIENEERIKDFIIMKEQRKKEAFKLAKRKGELLECMCCFDPDVMAEDMATCTDGHLFCKECIRRLC
ncbi:uncharacterized protein LOC110827567 isoform X2 [Zootermopsis nevadensis]|uniref:uncharacterized protein LOC110827567 isoform X2 n=1 Tax=Zootermopsis nevadensis TaxID=136037 RepID=UPI000B8E895F|nr:uncharacterized protein LOC110827567 isoform X2 [Zootermopsis nevadensis]